MASVEGRTPRIYPLIPPGMSHRAFFLSTNVECRLAGHFYFELVYWVRVLGQNEEKGRSINQK